MHNAVETPSRSVAPPAPQSPAPDALAQITASLVAPPPPRWRRALARIGHLWLLAGFIVVWELVSVYCQRINPQLDVMMPPPTAVVSAAADLLARHMLFTHIFDSLKRVLAAVGTATLLG